MSGLKVYKQRRMVGYGSTWRFFNYFWTVYDCLITKGDGTTKWI